MLLTDQVRETCRSIAESARFVSIDLERLGELEPGSPPELDAECHYLEGSPDDVADYMLTLDTINFGSGWFRRSVALGRAVVGFRTTSIEGGRRCWCVRAGAGS